MTKHPVEIVKVYQPTCGPIVIVCKGGAVEMSDPLDDLRRRLGMANPDDAAALLYPLMKSAGIGALDIQFSGGGDEGGVDQIVVTRQTSQTADERARAVEAVISNETALNEQIEQLCSDIVHGKYFGFAGEYSVSGAFHVDAEAETCVEHSDYDEP